MRKRSEREGLYKSVPDKCFQCSKKARAYKDKINSWAKSSGRHREKALNRNYKLSLSGYERLARGQRYRCRICLRKLELHVDHDHATGRVRGLLCCRCNTGLGKFEDSPNLLLNAVHYLTNGILKRALKNAAKTGE